MYVLIVVCFWKQDSICQAENRYWFAPNNYLTAKGVVKGYDKQTKFKPANNCTRAQMVKILYKYDKFVNGKG